MISKRKFPCWLKKKGLLLEIDIIEKSIQEKQKFGQVSLDEQKKAIESSKQFNDSLIQQGKMVQNTLDIKAGLLKEVEQKITEKEATLKDFISFIEKNKTVQQEYKEVQEKLLAAKNEFEVLSIKSSAQEKEILEANNRLDEKRKFVSDLHGKFASYVRVMKETLEYVNKNMAEKGGQIHFNLPPEEMMQIDINNFNQHEK